MPPIFAIIRTVSMFHKKAQSSQKSTPFGKLSCLKKLSSQYSSPFALPIHKLSTLSSSHDSEMWIMAFCTALLPRFRKVFLPSTDCRSRENFSEEVWAAFRTLPLLPLPQLFPRPVFFGYFPFHFLQQRTVLAGQYRLKTSPSNPFRAGCPKAACPAR